MVREVLFNDVDIVLHWHPDDSNSANSRTSNSNKSAKKISLDLKKILKLDPAIKRKLLPKLQDQIPLEHL